MSDTAQLNLREPEVVDWDNAFTGSKYQAPPPAVGPDGEPITYYGQVKELKEVDPDQGYLQYQVDLAITKSGTHDGQRVRAWVSARPFMKRNASGELEPVKGNPNSLAKMLIADGLQVKPTTNSEYRAAVKMINGKALPFTLDWEAKNKNTGEVIRGFQSFPPDTERPGMRKAVLKKGDKYQETDRDGNIVAIKEVESEILFANPRFKGFRSVSKTR